MTAYGKDLSALLYGYSSSLAKASLLWTRDLHDARHLVELCRFAFLAYFVIYPALVSKTHVNPRSLISLS